MEYKTIKEIAKTNPENINKDYNKDYIMYLDTANITNGSINELVEININEAPSRAKRIVKKNDIIYSTVRPNLCHYGILREVTENMIVSTGFCVIRCDNSKIIPEYLYAYLTLPSITEKLHAIAETSTSAYPSIRPSDIENVVIPVPDMEIQGKISKILSYIDKKIDINNQINDNLLNIIDTYFDEIFTDIECTKRADEIADITIGKTPPRAKAECFTKKDNDIKWLSISDIGRCGIYVFDTSEKLTLDAVNKYNVKIIPENTIVLSFKLTVGRVAITNEKMATNEAIAHFNLYDDRLRSYIYTYLRKFDYDKLGSTSSIATAVNSKIIKAMPIKVPDDGKIEKFNKLADEILKIIRINERENRRLGQLRDTLLPKLMNGELNLDKIEM